jgi:hypothetical protein
MMDSTLGTNNSGSDLFTVLAEVEGTGVPPKYLFTAMSPAQICSIEGHIMKGSNGHEGVSLLLPL